LAEFRDSQYPWQMEVDCHFHDVPEVKNRVLVCHRRSRKTTLALNILIREAGTKRKLTFAYIAPTFRQAKAIIWRDPMMLRTYLPEDILRKPFNETELIADFKTLSMLQIGGADDPDRWRGMGCFGWVLDEFASMRNGKMLYEEIIYPIIKENGGWVFFLYTPKGRNHGWEYYQKAKETKGWQSWFLPCTKSGLYTPEEIGQMRADMPPHLFAQEQMCEFLVSGGGVIPRIDEAISGVLEAPIRGQRYVMGVDLGKKVDWTVLTVLNRLTGHVSAFERFQKFDWTFQKERIARLAKEYCQPLTVVDSTGVGDPIEDDLKRMGLSVRGYQFTQRTKRQLIEKLIMAVADRRITFPDIPELVNELRDFDIDPKGKYSAPSGLHDDCVISLALAVEGLGAEVYGRVNRPHKRVRELDPMVA